MKTVLFHNPSAGDEGHRQEDLVALLRANGLQVEVRDPKGDTLRDGLSLPAKLVLVAGGDGTVGRIATGMEHRDIPLAMLPLGTANNLARALGPWPSPREFAEGWAQAARARLNVAVAEAAEGDKPFTRCRFVEAAGFGAFAHGVEHADRIGKEGVEAGRAAFRRTLADAVARQVRLTVDGEERNEETLLVEVMNIPLFGPNLVLAPEADPGDGLLDVVTLPPSRRALMLEWLDHPGAGPPPVEIRRGSAVTIDWPGGHIRLDDTPLDWSGPAKLHFRLEPEPLHVLIPPACLAAPKKASAS
ncbi:diacylglycerol/lipid kinase family protein [Pseudoroseomonas ludipueritiae]|uniref:NAD(+)/NADH kinase n=1 Tax=Pseudoroseomonas ludipueritiae TaxID=198093 RepID=A0ABR7RCK7_9PROT|nr:diacylglycerol kinase family protein [Pseudoroseomonas ludipueritiae]MBC9179414.1 NAD(+)/NADH kinase [Pseudoroseomonas ludipueritiae]MCG7364356.1 NAD(+)/NADH kinase [Roseomonas sp. ACRSG]